MKKKNYENFTWKITAGCFLNEIFTQKYKNLLDKKSLMKLLLKKNF